MHCELIALTHVHVLLRKCLPGISQSFKFCFAFKFEERKKIQRESTEQLIKMFCLLLIHLKIARMLTFLSFLKLYKLYV
jgi:hypothetical protein